MNKVIKAMLLVLLTGFIYPSQAQATNLVYSQYLDSNDNMLDISKNANHPTISVQSSCKFST